MERRFADWRMRSLSEEAGVMINLTERGPLGSGETADVHLLDSELGYGWEHNQRLNAWVKPVHLKQIALGGLAVILLSARDFFPGYFYYAGVIILFFAIFLILIVGLLRPPFSAFIKKQTFSIQFF